MKRAAGDRGGCNQRLQRFREAESNEQVQSALANFLVPHALPPAYATKLDWTFNCRLSLYVFSIVIHFSLIVDCRL